MTVMPLKKIVVVDHDRRFGQFCQARLEKEEAEVHIIATGIEALSILPREPFDLLLMEMWPSDMDSLDILGQLRAAGVRLPVIIASEQSELPVKRVAMALELGATTFIEKPCKAEDLVEAVSYALAQTRIEEPCRSEGRAA